MKSDETNVFIRFHQVSSDFIRFHQISSDFIRFHQVLSFCLFLDSFAGFWIKCAGLDSVYWLGWYGPHESYEVCHEGLGKGQGQGLGKGQSQGLGKGQAKGLGKGQAKGIA